MSYGDFLRAYYEMQWLARHFYPAVFRPMPVQEQFIRNRAKVSVLRGGNRSGKTEAGAIRASLMANNLMHKFYPEWPERTDPTRGWVIALDYNLAEICKKKLRVALGRSVRRWRERDRMFELKNGSTIWLKSEESGAQKFQADDIDWAWKDECGDLRSEGVFEEVIRGLADRDGPLWITMTPTLGSSWIGPRLYDPWLDGTGGEAKEHKRVIFFQMDSRDNVYLSRSGLQTLIDTYGGTPEGEAMRLRGDFVNLAGLVFPTFDLRRHVRPGFTPPRDWLRWRSMDFGLSAPSVCLWSAAEPAPTLKPCPYCKDEHTRPRLHVYRELYHTTPGKTVRDTCDRIKELSGEESYVQTLLDPSCWRQEAAPDAVGGHFVVAHEYERWGVYPEAANNDMEPSVERIWHLLGSGELPPQLVIHDTCPNLVMEMRRLSWKRGLGRGVPGPGLGDHIDKNQPDHAIDALRYVVMASPLEGGYTFSAPSGDDYDPDADAPHYRIILNDEGRPTFRAD